MKKTRRARQQIHPWFRGTPFVRRQPFQTFVQYSKTHEIIQTHLNALLSHPKRSSALEIGPGANPILSRFGFKEPHYIEQSKALAHQLTEKNPTAHVLVGDIRNPDVRPKKPVELIVLNELLTHIEPRRRLQVMKKLAAYTTAFFIIDRPQPKLADFRQWHHLETRFMARLQTKLGEKKQPPRKKSASELAQEHTRLVAFEPLVEYLTQEGFNVQSHTYGAYRILTAKKA